MPMESFFLNYYSLTEVRLKDTGEMKTFWTTNHLGVLFLLHEALTLAILPILRNNTVEDLAPQGWKPQRLSKQWQRAPTIWVARTSGFQGPLTGLLPPTSYHHSLALLASQASGPPTGTIIILFCLSLSIPGKIGF